MNLAAMESYGTVLDRLFYGEVPHPELSVIKALKSLHPNDQHVPVIENPRASNFDLASYLDSVAVPYTIPPSLTHVHFVYLDPKSERVVPNTIVGVLTFTYDAVEFIAYKATWRHANADFVFYDLVFSGVDDSAGTKLASAVFKWANDLKEELWVFEMGTWKKSKELYKAIQDAQWDDIILDQAFRDNLRRDTRTFFESHDVYRSLNITWKRGLLLLGPPGNGKTESIKALLHEFEYPALYVKSITTPSGPEYGVRQVFQHARAHAPCILVLEDLDSMVTDEVRSFFLNELDGLAKNEGILTIATTNHPERIDDAILNRPSRFDVKYNFALPEDNLRFEFILKWLGKAVALGPNAGIVFEASEAEVAANVVAKTEGWSFAFMKELFVSFLLRVAHDKALHGNDMSGTMDERLYQQIDQLSAQITRTKETEKTPEQSHFAGRRVSIAPVRYQTAQPTTRSKF